MKVEPISIKTLGGPRRLEVETRSAAAELPNSSAGDFASFDSIEISNPVAPPEQMIGSGATLSDNSGDTYVDPNAQATPEGDLQAPSLATMLRAIKGYLAEDLKKIHEHQDAAPVQQQQAQNAQGPAQHAPAQAAAQIPGVKVVDPTKKSEPIEEGSHPAIPMPQGGFKPVEAQKAPPPPAPTPAPAPAQHAPVKTEAPPQHPHHEHQAA